MQQVVKQMDFKADDSMDILKPLGRKVPKSKRSNAKKANTPFVITSNMSIIIILTIQSIKCVGYNLEPDRFVQLKTNKPLSNPSNHKSMTDANHLTKSRHTRNTTLTISDPFIFIQWLVQPLSIWGTWRWNGSLETPFWPRSATTAWSSPVTWWIGRWTQMLVERGGFVPFLPFFVFSSLLISFERPEMYCKCPSLWISFLVILSHVERGVLSKSFVHEANRCLIKYPGGQVSMEKNWDVRHLRLFGYPVVFGQGHQRLSFDLDPDALDIWQVQRANWFGCFERSGARCSLGIRWPSAGCVEVVTSWFH